METNWAFNGDDNRVAPSLAPSFVPMVVDGEHLGKVVLMLTVDLVAGLHQLEVSPKSFNGEPPAL